MRWTRAVTPQPTARLATTEIGRPDPLTTAVIPNRTMAASSVRCIHRLR